MHTDIEDIHAYWFGPLDEAGLCLEDRNRLWFGADADTDATCRRRFSVALGRALAGRLDDWAGSDRGLVALILLLDQFSRNIHRGTAQAFAGDAQALALARSAIDAGRHRALPAIHRVFLYLPLEHSEDPAAQETCVKLFLELEETAGKAAIAGFTRYALAHRDVIARFGRFPHRNAILGRASTPAELAHLREHGGF